MSTNELQVIGEGLPPIVYDITKAEIAKLRKRFEKITTAEGKENYLAVKEGIGELTGLRTSLETKRKELKAGALEFGREVDSRAKEIEAELRSIEDPLKALKKEVDDEKDRIRKEKIEKEENRVAGIMQRINVIQTYRPLDPNLDSGTIKNKLKELQVMVIDGTFEEFKSQAQEELNNSIAVYENGLAKRIAYEEEEKRQNAEKKKLAEEKAEFEKQQAEFKKQQEQAAAAALERKQDEEKKAAAEQAVKDAEAKAAQKAEQERKALEERKAREAEEERIRLEALPDKKRMNEFFTDLAAYFHDNRPELKSKKAKDLMSSITASHAEVVANFIKSTEEL